ncbi:hypothetical protein LTS08_001305 [Lithohypha guttulata]|uniref:uncharacterized protein n=1 Tax=Lithohypha guttulata TaxID=1690604 RepID=UPI002DDFEA87|nr:hypothetical protein LTR51_007694 [Lithohypha guttulata]KAK5105032.1 hypothetical protein LTS08_001305 [Lithohypha guttulata]
MDLSSLSSNQNYRRPDRLQPARPPSPDAKSTAMGIFDKLLAEQKQKYQGGGGTRTSTATATPPQFNSDHYGRGGSLSQRTTTSPSSPFNPRSMVPPRSANDINNSVMGNLVGDLNASREESLRLTPSLGRQIRVTEVFDLTKTIQLLESRINSRGNDAGPAEEDEEEGEVEAAV